MSFESEIKELRKKRIEEGVKPRKLTDTVKTDIAPLREKEDTSGLFKAGTLDDDFISLRDALALGGTATLGDISAGILQGVGGLVEGVTDLGAYGVAGILHATGNHSAAWDVKNLAKEDTVAGFMNDLREKSGISEYSFLGDFGYDVASGVGYITGLAAGGALAKAVGVTGKGLSAVSKIIMGLSGMGSGMSEAYSNGATDGEATAYGAMSAGAEVLSEMMFSGLGSAFQKLGVGTGLIDLDDVITKKLTKNITNNAVKNLLQLGIKASGEGIEEVVSGFLSSLAKKTTYKSEEDYGKILADEDLLKQAFSGFLVSLISQSGDVMSSTSQGREFVTGLTDNEQKVVDKVYENRVTEAEKDGKLTTKDKNRIYDEVVEDLKEGGIDIDTIEEVLGGETYKNYKNTVDSEDALKKELDSLRQMKKSDMNDIQSERLEELKGMNLSDTSKRNDLKTQLGKEVYDLAKDGYLAESYSERARRGEKFTADLTKYKGKQAEIVQKAIDGGFLNNTRKTHALVDLIAKVGGDKDIDFDFTNNEKLKNSGFAIDGKIINGYVTKDGVTVNVNSKKALNSVVGHEITHVLEGTELYNELRNAVYEYSKTKGDYDSRRANIENLYNDMKGADIDAELTADLVGDYLFTDTDFVRSLSTKNRSLFEKLFDEIKYLCKIATAGSKEARQLEAVKKAFQEAYRESGKSTRDDTNSLKQTGENATEQPTEVNLSEKLSPEDAQAMNIMASNIVKAAKATGLSLDDYYKATENINAFNPTRADANAIADALEEYVEVMDKDVYRGYLEKIREFGGGNELFESNDVSYSLGEIIGESGENYGIGVHLDSTLLTNLTDEERIEMVKEYVKELGGSVFTAYDGNQNPVNIHLVESNKKFKNKSGKKVPVNKDLTGYLNNKVKQESIALIDELITASSFIGIEQAHHPHDWVDNNGLNDWDVWTTYLQDKENTVWKANLRIANSSNGDKILYEIYPIEMVEQSGTSDTSSTNDIIPQTEEKVNTFEEKNQKKSLSFEDEAPTRIRGGIYGEDVALEAPVAENIAPVKETVSEETPIAPIRSNVETETVAPAAVNEPPIITTKQKIAAQVKASQTELEKNIQARKDSSDFYDKEIAHAQSLLDGKKNKNTKSAQALVRRIERLTRLKSSEDANFQKRINDIKSRIERLNDKSLSNHDRADRLESFKRRSEAKLEAEKNVLAQEFEQKRSKLQKEIADKNSYISKRASELYNEISNLKKGVRASKELGYLLDHGYEWKSIKTALLNTKNRPGQRVDFNSVAESTVREMLNEEYEGKVYELDELDAEYNDEVAKLETEAEKELEAFKVANQRNVKQQEYSVLMENLVGDTSTWVDKKLGLQYKTNTLRRNLRDIVRDENGNKDIEKADAIYDELQGNYNHNEASLNRETNQIKKPYAEMKFTKAEDAYIQMLGEFRNNPDTSLTKDVVEEFYNKHKDSIDVVKVDKAIDMARETYDSLLERVNEVLREQGMKEIPYRKGYFPHFTEDKQSWLAKLLNWKTQNNDIPTDIAGLTEQFNPNRSWQSFNKQRKTDTTDYSFSKGLDTYVQGSLDWIYHIEDIQKRRALENYIRYSHSEQGVKDKIDAIRQNDQYDADEMQEQIDLVYKNANNPLNNFVSDLRAGTNRLANKKSSLDRGMEEMVNRKVYSTITNLSNRVTANMVGGSISSALTNFIPITQSWGQVSPVSSLRAMGETIRSAFKNDGVVDKSDFLTNRLNTAENLYKTTWDKIGEKVSFLMDVVDNFTAQTVWRSKYLENINNGMSENTAIKDADQFAENVIAGRSRGNNPTIFDSKNPLIKTLTAFQLEVSNQYGYMLKDMPTDMRNETKAKLIKGYATMFIGAYVYNALYSSLTGRDAALDPIGIIEELLGDLFDDDEEETDAILNLVDNVVEEVPFVGGLMGGGRIPISSAMPYDGDLMKSLKGALDIFTLKDDGEATREWLKPVIYLGLPMGGGQIKKTLEGLSMFSDDHPIAGSYTDSGNLRFPVEDTIGNRIQAGIFGQWANKNAQTYLDEGYAPLDEKLVQEYKDVGMPINDYWEYRRGLNKYSTLAEKADYINSLNLTTEQKNILINNLSDRKEPIDMTNYGNYGSFDEFDFATKNPGKYTVSKVVGGYEAYKQYLSDLNNIKSDKDKYGNSITNSRKTKVIEYINGLDISYEDKIILYKSEYKSDDSFNYEIVKYLNSREDLSYNDIKSILTELGFHVDSKGNISWD